MKSDEGPMTSGVTTGQQFEDALRTAEALMKQADCEQERAGRLLAAEIGTTAAAIAIAIIIAIVGLSSGFVSRALVVIAGGLAGLVVAVAMHFTVRARLIDQSHRDEQAAVDVVSLLREVVGMYLKALAADTEERDLGLARARFHLGRCLLKTGMEEDGLAESQAGLELAADVLDRLQVRTPEPGWLVAAPRYLQLAAPDWAAAAVRAMTLHAAAMRWQQAATAARTAVLVSGGLADLGGEPLRDAHAAIKSRADQVIEQAARADGRS